MIDIMSPVKKWDYKRQDLVFSVKLHFIYDEKWIKGQKEFKQKHVSNSWDIADIDKHLDKW